MSCQFRKATVTEIPEIWNILQQAIIRRKADGSEQWQDGYPNPQVVQKDIEKGAGYVLIDGTAVIGYSAVLVNDEPAYSKINGNWLSDDNFVVFHRVAISEQYLGQGLAQTILKFIEEFALQNKIYSIKADTNHDNTAMLKTFEKSGYTFCGEVYLRGNPRKAFEKILVKKDESSEA